MTPNSDPPLSDETQDAAEDFEEPRPQDVGPSQSATSSSSSSFNKIFVKNSALEDMISSVDGSSPVTTDSAGVSHDGIRLLDPTKEPGYRPRGDLHTSQASSSWEVRDQPRRSPADEPEDRGRMLELHTGPPVPPRMIFSPEDKHRRQLLQNQVSIKRQQYEQALLRLCTRAMKGTTSATLIFTERCSSPTEMSHPARQYLQ
jgi:rRNA maturation protein Nop10